MARTRNGRSPSQVQEVLRTSQDLPNAASSQQVDASNISTTDTTSAEASGDYAKKQGRGPTFMRNVWGQSESERISVTYNDKGQPNDIENTKTLSHFLGCVARNGRYAPLNYDDWRKLPAHKKEEMVRLVKSKFDIPSGGESFILKSIAKKWKDWKSVLKSLHFNPDLPVEDQISNVPNRVHEDHWKYLLEYWTSEKGEAISARNKDHREKQEIVHRKGKMAFPVVKENLKKTLGHEPSRVEMFIECYTPKTNGKPAYDVAREKIDRMVDLLARQPQSSNDDVATENDIFSQVMGKDKSWVRMYGLVVSRSDIWGSTPSRSTCYRMAMEYKSAYELVREELGDLRNQKRELRSGPSSSNGTSASVHPQPIHQSVSPVERVSPSQPRVIKVGSPVVLKRIVDMETVALGHVHSMDPLTRVGREELGPNWCEIHVSVVVKPNEALIRRYGVFRTIGDTTGAPIAWPLSLVALDESNCD